MPVDLVVEDCTVVTPEGRVGPGAGVAVEDGRVVGVGRDDRLPPAAERLDAGGDHLAPGVVDCHIHNRTPGLDYKEDWETATRAAAAGGVTTVVGMPNTDPPVDRPERLRRKFDLGERRALVDFQAYAVITSENLDRIPALDRAGALGFKVFLGTTVGEIPPPNDGELLEAMEAVAATGKRLGFHEENDDIPAHLAAKFRREGRNAPIDHSHSRPAVAEREAVSRTILFAEETGAAVHMFHLSCGTGARIVARGKADGVDVTAETTPHYLWFTEEVMHEKGNIARVQPPIRDAEERALLWEHLGDAVDCVATDHAPHTDAEKGIDDPFGNTWESVSGFVGLETEVPAMLTFVDEGRLTMEEWTRLHSRRPAQVWGMYPRKGSLQVGTDADFTLFDPGREWTLEDRASLHSKNTVTPFEGERFVGRPTATVVRGEVVYREGEGVTGAPGHGTRVDVDGAGSEG